jgi:hypothetical protein
VIRFRYDSQGIFIGAVVNSGKNITVVDTRYRNLLVNLYRGLSSAKITRIDYSTSCNYITVTSDHNTIHFYDIGEQIRNHKATSTFTTTINSEASFKIPNLTYQATKLLKSKNDVPKFTFNKDMNATVPSCTQSMHKCEVDSIIEMDVVNDQCKLVRVQIIKDEKDKYVAKGLT